MAIPLPESRPGMQSTDYVYPIFMLTAVPNILKGFLIVAILSAAMSSASSALTSLASVATMDFVKAILAEARSEKFYLRFSRISTVGWAALLIVVAVWTRQAESVLNAAFALRGLTSGALLGGLLLAVFWRKGRAAPIITGMLCSLLVMTAISPMVQSNLPEGWPRLSIKVAFPWYTLIGCTVMVLVAWLVRRLICD